MNLEFSVNLREGPVFSGETFYNDGNGWKEQTVTFRGLPNITFSIEDVFSGARSYPFVVSCVAIGAHPTNLLLGAAPSPSMVFVGPGQWQPYINATISPGASGPPIIPFICSDYNDTVHVTRADEFLVTLDFFLRYQCSGKTIIIDGPLKLAIARTYQIYEDLAILASAPGSINITDYTFR